MNGTKLFVYDAITADYLITAVRTGDNRVGEKGSLLLKPVKEMEMLFR